MMTKKDNKIWWIIGIVLVIIIVSKTNPETFAVTNPSLPKCDTSLSQKCQLTKSITLKNQIYNVGNGNLIEINSGGIITINCNGATFVGNNNETVFYMNSRRNVKFMNCNFKNVKFPIYFKYPKSININNFNVQNGTLYLFYADRLSVTNSVFNGSNNVFDGSFYYTNSNIILDGEYKNVNIKNNKFLGTLTNAISQSYSGSVHNSIYIGYNYFKQGGISLTNIDNSIIEYNTWDGAISGKKGGSHAIKIYYGYNNKYRYNKFLNNNNTSYTLCAYNQLINNPSSLCTDINLNGEKNSEVYGNIHINSNNWANTEIYKSSYIKVHDNSHDFNDRAIRAVSSSNIEIYKNKISNSVMHFDGYDGAISLEYGVTNSKIYDNEITNYGTYGIFYRKVSGISIYNNNINAMPLSEKMKYKVNDGGDYPCAIAGMELIKTWTGDAAEKCFSYPGQYDTISKISGYASSGITLSNNKFGSNVQCLFRDQGGINIAHDLNNFWYREFQTPTTLVNKDKIYFSNNFIIPTSKSKIIGQGECGKIFVVYNHTKSFDYYKNLDTKINTLKLVLNGGSVTNNGKIVCNTCNGNFDININPGKEVFVRY